MKVFEHVAPPRASASREGRCEPPRGDGEWDVDAQRLLHRLPVALVVHSPDAVVRYANPSARKLLGLAPEEMLGCPADEASWRFVREDGSAMPAAESPVNRVLTTGKPVSHHLLGVVPGSGRPLRRAYVDAHPDTDANGVLRQVVVTFVEVTDDSLRQLNREVERCVAARTAQLEAANRELEAFAVSVSHDLRAPLRAIDGYSRIVAEDYEDKIDAEGKRLLGVVRENTARMTQLLDDILRFSRAGRHELERDEVDLAALARAQFDEQAELAAGRDLRLVVGTLPSARGDRTMLRQVLANLISNAIKFTAPREQALIEIGGEPGPSENRYWVRDNGAGFDMKDVDKLFGVFQRLHTDEQFEGTGVGLAIVKRIVSRHGGRVWAEGRPEEGATVHFTLPRGEA